jgi:hypothetical protein
VSLLDCCLLQLARKGLPAIVIGEIGFTRSTIYKFPLGALTQDTQSAPAAQGYSAGHIG